VTTILIGSDDTDIFWHTTLLQLRQSLTEGGPHWLATSMER
jgi:hypothetical protein